MLATSRISRLLRNSTMKAILCLALTAITCIGSTLTYAHHSFASYDFSIQVTYTGVVKDLKFRNPHIAMTLVHTREAGTEEIINFIEGAPANMLARIGLRPEMIKAGT